MKTFWHVAVEYHNLDSNRSSAVFASEATKEAAIADCLAHVGFYTRPGYLVTLARVSAQCAACENEGTVGEWWEGGRRVVCPDCKGRGANDVTTLINLDGGHADILRGYNHCHQGTPWRG